MTPSVPAYQESSHGLSWVLWSGFQCELKQLTLNADK